MRRWVVYFTILFISCRLNYEAPLPTDNWALFDASKPLDSDSILKVMQGIYFVQEGVGAFNNKAVCKYSYIAKTGTDTLRFISFFLEQNAAFMVLEPRLSGDSIILKGYWRKMLNTETGKIRLSYKNRSFKGGFGAGTKNPELVMQMQYASSLKTDTGFYIIAHRGGGRNSDLLPDSENSLEMMRKAAQYGATAVEIDISLTSDGVPVVYHDDKINERSTQKSGLVGDIKNYNYNQLEALVRLIHGEKIPTLAQALETIYKETPLRAVWLDNKDPDALPQVREIQSKFLERAKQDGKDFKIWIGVPSEEVKKAVLKLPDYNLISSLCELEIKDLNDIGATVWAPRWTLGLQNNEVQNLQQQGRTVFTWTVDVPQYAKQYIQQGKFNGILSNYPSLIAYYHYVNLNKEVE